MHIVMQAILTYINRRLVAFPCLPYQVTPCRAHQVSGARTNRRIDPFLRPRQHPPYLHAPGGGRLMEVSFRRAGDGAAWDERSLAGFRGMLQATVRTVRVQQKSLAQVFSGCMPMHDWR